MDTEREEFEALVRRCQAAVCAVAYARLRDRAHSEEIAQEAFLVAWLRRRDTTPSVGWICGIAKNLARNAHRRPREVTMMSAPSSRDPRDEMIERERTRQAVAALAELPEPYREAVVLYYRSEESLAEVAGALGITEVAARQRVHRGRLKLREMLASVEETLRESRPSAAFTAAVVGAWLVRGRDAAAATATRTATSATASTLATYMLLGGMAAGVAVVGTVVAAGSGAFAARSAGATETSRMNASGASETTARGLEVRAGAGSTTRGALAAPTPPALPTAQGIDLQLSQVPVEVLIGLCGDSLGIPVMVDPTVPASVTDISGSGLDPVAVLDDTLAKIHAQRDEVQAIKVVSFGGRRDAATLGGDPVTIHVADWPVDNVLRLLSAPLHMPIGNPPSPMFDDQAVEPPHVSLDVDGEPAGVALERVLAQADLRYEFASGFKITLKAN